MHRVMFVGHSAKASGGEIALARLIAALGGLIEPLVVLAEDGPMVERLRAQGVPVLVEPLSPIVRELHKDALINPLVALRYALTVIRYANDIRRLIRIHQIDIVHANTLKAGIYGCLAALAAGVPSIWHLRDRLSYDYLPRLAVVGMRMALALLPTTVVCNSRATLATVARKRKRKRWRRSASGPVVIYDVLDYPMTRRPSGEADEFRVGMVGRLAPWKGQVVALRAFARAQLRQPSRLIFVGSAIFGEAEYEATLREAIDDLNLTEQVDLVGFVEDVFPVLQTFDVMVHASTIPEPFGQVIVEALAAGVPVVAASSGGPAEILTDRVNGLLYEPGDEASLAQLLRLLQDDLVLRSHLRNEGMRRAADYSPIVIAPQMVDLYRLVSEQRGLLPRTRRQKPSRGLGVEIK